TGASVIAAACPFCNTMMTDGVKNSNKEEEVQVLDIAELVAMSIKN
ncbi:MAG TPA: CoB--CoM heterodisulfide reductase, partial [Chitinophagaceae bacterium]|nr:CoB--CoM heterodisulfide reductase [Chitinophagaceae bacterium]